MRNPVNFRNGVASMGAPLGTDNPIMGKVWYVDGTNGSDNNSGTGPGRAFKTIQKAITTQIALTTGLGDVIYVLPGTYAESLTGDLTRVSIIGLPLAYGIAHTVSIRPTASYAYYGTMFEAALKNLILMSPSASNKTLPAVQLPNMRYSVIDNCFFVGRDPTSVEGLQIGNTDAVATAANCDYSQIINNRFGTFYGAASQFAYGIKLGRVDYDAGASVKQFWGSLIANNIIYASTMGIYLGIYGDKGYESLITQNYISSDEGADDEGCSTFCIAAYGTNYGVMVTNNRCATAATAVSISGFQTGHIIDNHTSQNGVQKIENATA